MTRVIWVGEVHDHRVRIVREGTGDCVVEYSGLAEPDVHVDRHWSPIDDDALAAQVYLTAYLQARETLEGIYKASRVSRAWSH